MAGRGVVVVREHLERCHESGKGKAVSCGRALLWAPYSSSLTVMEEGAA